MYIWRTRGDLLSIRETHPSLDCTCEIKGIRFIRLNEFISSLLRYPRGSSSYLKIFQRTTSQLTSYVETFPISCVKTNQFDSLFSLSLCGRTIARWSLEWWESTSRVDARDQQHMDHWYQTRTPGLRDAGKLIVILTVILLRRGNLFRTV